MAAPRLADHGPCLADERLHILRREEGKGGAFAAGVPDTIFDRLTERGIGWRVYAGETFRYRCSWFTNGSARRCGG